MKITLINGDTGNNTEFNNKISEIILKLKESGKNIEVFVLRDLKILYCTGCWSCWVKTPGVCIFNDDTDNIRKSIINSDFVLFASPLYMGYPGTLIKKIQDKLIPLLHPYIELVNDECHHYKRYTKYPEIGLIFMKEPETDNEDIEILKNIFERFALNFKSRLSVFKEIDNLTPELYEVIDN